MSLNGVRPRRPEQSGGERGFTTGDERVSMESGLEDRNNLNNPVHLCLLLAVSMESGLEDRNNLTGAVELLVASSVSMESGLEDRNNQGGSPPAPGQDTRLNGVRPRRPEQCTSPPPATTPPAASQWSPA